MKCSRPKCHNKSRRRGLCAAHYRLIPSGYVPAQPVLDRYNLLRSRGLTVAEIARLSGLNRDTLRLVGKWPGGNVRIETAERLLAVRIPRAVIASGAKVPALGTQRRLQALAAIGHSLGDIGAELGITQQAVTQVLRRDVVAASTAAKVAELYSRLENTEGSSVRARTWALKRGWLAPIFWDDIDDPTEVPEAADRRMSFEERLAELEYLHIPRSQMPQWLGIQDESFERQLQRHGLKEAV